MKTNEPSPCGLLQISPSRFRSEYDESRRIGEAYNKFMTILSDTFDGRQFTKDVPAGIKSCVTSFLKELVRQSLISDRCLGGLDIEVHFLFSGTYMIFITSAVTSQPVSPEAFAILARLYTITGFSFEPNRNKII